MQTQQINSFQCKLHPSERMCALTQNNDRTISFYCVKCMNPNKFSEMKSLECLIDEIAEGNHAYNTFSRNNQVVPTERREHLSKKQERVQILENHIENEKNKVKSAFSYIKKELKILLKKAQKSIEAELDAQIGPYKVFYDQYEKEIERSYNQDAQSRLNPNKDSLIQQINMCSNIDSLERTLKERTNFGLSGQDLNAKIAEIDDGFALFESFFENAKPSCYFKDGSSIDDRVKEVMDKLSKTISPILSEIPKVLDMIPKYPEAMKFNSSIINNSAQKFIFLNWILESKPQVSSLKLLYRATRDGFASTNFHTLCDNHGPTITVVKSETNKVFGGYTDGKWHQNNAHTNSQKAWLFSLDRKEKYPVKQANAGNAINGNVNCGPIFGGGHDILICNNSNTSNSSYSKFGHSYETGIVPPNETQSALAGSYYFKTVEIEVYEIL